MAEGASGRLRGSPAADRLKEEWEGYLAAQAERLLAGTGRALGRSAVRLKDIAEGDSPAFRAVVLDGARRIARGRGPVGAAVGVGVSRLRDKGLRTLRERSRLGGAVRHRPVVVTEAVDVGVPVKDAYDEWFRHPGVLRFARGATEEVPEVRVAWTSQDEGAATRGAATFHELAADLTRVLVTVEHHPRGLRGRAGALRGIQRRRIRRGLRDYARFLALEEEPPGADESADGEYGDCGEYEQHEDGEAYGAPDDGPVDELPADAYEDGRGRS